MKGATEKLKIPTAARLLVHTYPTMQKGAPLKISSDTSFVAQRALYFIYINCTIGTSVSCMPQRATPPPHDRSLKERYQEIFSLRYLSSKSSCNKAIPQMIDSADAVSNEFEQINSLIS